MFEHRFNSFLKTFGDTVTSKDDSCQLAKETNSKESTSSYNESKEPIFDENFDLINVSVVKSSTFLPSDPHKPVKNTNQIKTVQVSNLFFYKVSVTSKA